MPIPHRRQLIPRQPPKRLAYVDESMRPPADGPGSYLLAAVMVEAEQCGSLRVSLRELRLTRQPRLHWRTEGAKRRLGLATAIGALGCNGIVVVGVQANPRRQERARRQCLERLLWELDREHVDLVVAETRQAVRDAADDEAIGAFRRAQVISDRLIFTHDQPSAEPLLWLPDVVAGAVSHDRYGEPEYRAALGDRIRIIEIRLR